MQIKQSTKWRGGVESARERSGQKCVFYLCKLSIHTHTDEVTTHTHTPCLHAKVSFFIACGELEQRQLAISNWGMARKKPPKLAKNGGRNFGGIDFAKPK